MSNFGDHDTQELYSDVFDAPEDGAVSLHFLLRSLHKSKRRRCRSTRLDATRLLAKTANNGPSEGAV